MQIRDWFVDLIKMEIYQVIFSLFILIMRPMVLKGTLSPGCHRGWGYRQEISIVMDRPIKSRLQPIRYAKWD